ncbi:MAG: phosphoethanolamine transferase [Succinivibrio sp.]
MIFFKKVPPILTKLLSKISSGINHTYSWYLVFYAVTLYYSTVLNQQLLEHFYRLIAHEDFSLLFRITPPVVLFSLLCIVFLCFSFKYIFKAVLSVLLITGSIVGYYANRYGIIFDYDMMINVLQTNTAEAKSYVNLTSVCAILLTGVIPALILLRIKIRWPSSVLKGTLSRLLILSVAVLSLFTVSKAYYQTYASIARNNSILRKEISPYNYLWATYGAVRDTYFPENTVFTSIAMDSVIDNPEERPELFVFVLGETARASNFKHNGYTKDTDPFTDRFSNITKFAPIASCGTATAVSVPCMFSILNRNEYKDSKARNMSSLVDVLKYAGYDVMWYENDGGCKGVCDRVDNETINPYDPQNRKYCKDGTCFDEVLIGKLKSRLKIAADKKKSTVIFLHIIGSHGPTYASRVPENMKVFKPNCRSGEIEKCSVEEIVNSYDNTLYYTDYVISRAIRELEPYSDKFGTALFYVSDHGESLGEGGLFLHGAPYMVAPKQQKQVPALTWFSDSFVFDHKLNLSCLDRVALRTNLSHDNVFHSILGILDVNTSFYDEREDIFSGCRIWNRKNASLHNKNRKMLVQ